MVTLLGFVLIFRLGFVFLRVVNVWVHSGLGSPNVLGKGRVARRSAGDNVPIVIESAACTHLCGRWSKWDGWYISSANPLHARRGGSAARGHRYGAVARAKWAEREIVDL